MTETLGATWMVTAGILGAAVILTLWLRKRGWAQQDEPGIRVKNGSIYAETFSSEGFQKAGSEWETKLKLPDKCFDLAVTTAGGTATQRLSGVKKFTVQDLKGIEHDFDMSGRKFRLGARGSWNPVPGNKKRLQHNDGVLHIVYVRAENQDGVKLASPFGVNDPMNLDEIVVSPSTVACK